jgi:hypothetical protein
MRQDENEYQTEPMESSPPAYPPRNDTSSEAGAADGTAGEDVAYDGSIMGRAVPDREVPRAVDETPADLPTNERTALFESNELDEFNGRWSEIQTSFVDEPRRAVQQADALVSDVITRIGDSFGKQRAGLEGQWDKGGNVSTEDLRQIFQRYRSFFSRLLGI